MLSSGGRCSSPTGGSPPSPLPDHSLATRSLDWGGRAEVFPERPSRHQSHSPLLPAANRIRRNFVFRRNFPIHKLFERSCDPGLFCLTADKLSQLFGFRLHKRIRGKLATVLDRMDHGHHVRARGNNGRGVGGVACFLNTYFRSAGGARWFVQRRWITLPRQKGWL